MLLCESLARKVWRERLPFADGWKPVDIEKLSIHAGLASTHGEFEDQNLDGHGNTVVISGLNRVNVGKTCDGRYGPVDDSRLIRSDHQCRVLRVVSAKPQGAYVPCLSGAIRDLSGGAVSKAERI